jgi:hypothetical protein
MAVGPVFICAVYIGLFVSKIQCNKTGLILDAAKGVLQVFVRL